MEEYPRCRCGHRSYDHFGSGSCNEGTKRCRCMRFNLEEVVAGETGESSNGA